MPSLIFLFVNLPFFSINSTWSLEFISPLILIVAEWRDKFRRSWGKLQVTKSSDFQDASIQHLDSRGCPSQVNKNEIHSYAFHSNHPDGSTKDSGCISDHPFSLLLGFLGTFHTSSRPSLDPLWLSLATFGWDSSFPNSPNFPGGACSPTGPSNNTAHDGWK